MEETVKILARDAPVVVATFLFSGWLIRLIVKEVMVPRLDRLIALLDYLIDLTEDVNRKRR